MSPNRSIFPVRCVLEQRSATTLRQELSLLSTLVAGGAPQLVLDERDRERVNIAAQMLENDVDGHAVDFPEDLQLLDGFWTLLYSSETDAVPKGATFIRQNYKVAERRVENCVTMALRIPRLPGAPQQVIGEFVIGASFEVTSKDTIELSLVDVQLKLQEFMGNRLRDLTPRVPLPSIQLPSFAISRRTSSDVRTTYYGEQLRVTRSSGGELRIFCKQR